MTDTLTTIDRHPTDTTPTTTAYAAAYGAAAWALGFAGVNLYLQAVGIDGLQQHWAAFTSINVGVTVLKAVGAAVALATVHGSGRRVPAGLLSTCAWGAAVMLLLYPAFGLAATVVSGDLLGWTLAGGTFDIPVLAYLGFFAAGGSLFAVTARQHQRHAGVSRRWPLLGAVGAPLLLTSVLFAASLVF